jgi:hypothetical protein
MARPHTCVLRWDSASPSLVVALDSVEGEWCCTHTLSISVTIALTSHFVGPTFIWQRGGSRHSALPLISICLSQSGTRCVRVRVRVRVCVCVCVCVRAYVCVHTFCSRKVFELFAFDLVWFAQVSTAGSSTRGHSHVFITQPLHGQLLVSVGERRQLFSFWLMFMMTLQLRYATRSLVSSSLCVVELVFQVADLLAQPP